MKRILLLLFCTGLLINLSMAQNKNTLIRTPSLNTDGSTIAFSSQGDIWTMAVNNPTPKRLTIHEGYEYQPVWNTKGTSIAFSSSRYGNDDIFTIDKDGGIPTQITYYSSGDLIYDWSNNDELLFTSNRAYRQIEWNREIYKVNGAGGTPQRALDAVGDMPKTSPNGRFVAIVRGSCRTAREDYNGPADREVWLYDTKTNKYIAITDNETNDFLPDWGDDNTLYFIGVNAGRYNISSQKIDDNGQPQGTPTALTTYNDDGVLHFDASADGKQIVFSRGITTYMMNTGSKSIAELKINTASDYRFDPISNESFKNGITEYDVSPNGKLTAMVIRGEVFVKQNDKEKSRSTNLSNHAYRERGTTWLNDSTLIFTSDRGGNNDLYMAQSIDTKQTNIFKSLKHEVKQLTKTSTNESNPMVSPDGKRIVYQVGRGGLKVANIDVNGKLSNEKTLLDGWDGPDGVTWSPDSKWLAYGLSGLTFNNEIYIQAADNSRKPVNVSMHPRGDFRPRWSRDGSKLAFTSNRINDSDIWFVWLKKEDWEKTKADRDEGYYYEEDDTSEKKGKDKKESITPIQIDFENIHDRQVQVTSTAGDEGNIEISQDGETFYYTAMNLVAKKNDLYSVKWDGTASKQLTKGGLVPTNIRLDAEGKKLYALLAGKMSTIDPSSGKKTNLPHSAKMKIDHDAENEQIFEEAWEALSEGFYDPDFHGQSWTGLKAKYKPWTMATTTTQDFRYMFNLMLGQLNASHMGLRGGNPETTQRLRAAKIGVELTPQKNGVKINHVVPGTPADKANSELYEGETILAVNGETLTNTSNFYSLMIGEANNAMLLEVAGKTGKKREVVIRPVNSINTQLYEEWITTKKKLTDQYSNGRLGYIHIRGMNMPSFERFERELMASGYGKEGIVIDVRFNGGGWTTDYLMAVLNVKQHGYTVPRGSAKSLDENPKFKNYYPFSERLPLSAWTKPSVALCNQSSYSNAEIFSHAYKHLGIGKLVGMPTFGAVISTGGQRLIDGSLVRMPFRGWYVKATGKNMENGPAVPDVIVENAPEEKGKGMDSQLKKSVEVMLSEIDD